MQDGHSQPSKFRRNEFEIPGRKDLHLMILKASKITEWIFYFSSVFLEVEKFNIESQGCVWWDDWRISIDPVCITWWTNDSCTLALSHLHNSFIPPSDYLTNSDLEFKRLLPLYTGVEDWTIHQSSMVVHEYDWTFRAQFAFSFIVEGNFKLLFFLSWHPIEFYNF